eukprot:scaffold2133_cov135-Isochrysis_galbana.AAC.2
MSVAPPMRKLCAPASCTGTPHRRAIRLAKARISCVVIARAPTPVRRRRRKKKGGGLAHRGGPYGTAPARVTPPELLDGMYRASCAPNCGDEYRHAGRAPPSLDGEHVHNGTCAAAALGNIYVAVTDMADLAASEEADVRHRRSGPQIGVYQVRGSRQQTRC